MGRTHSLAYTVMPFYKWPVRLMPRKVVIADIVEDLAADAAARFGFEKYTTN